MSTPFNKLTPAQVERLAMLSEELGEVQQVIGKILRHGYDSWHPDHPGTNNRVLLAEELGHVYYATSKLFDDGEILYSKVADAFRDKQERVKQYLHHNED